MRVLKNLIFIILVVSFFDTLKIRNPNYQISASESSGVDINFGESFAVDQNIKNLKDREKLYEREIIDKVKQGRSIEYKIGTPIRVNSFLKGEYCREMGGPLSTASSQGIFSSLSLYEPNKKSDVT